MHTHLSTTAQQVTAVPSQRTRTSPGLPARSPKGVVLRVVRSAMSADWAPFSAAEELVRYVDGEVQLLEVARARIQACVSSTSTVIQARALATLNVAINRVNEQRGHR